MIASIGPFWDANETWLVLGDMKELGPGELELHREAGAAARQGG